MHEQTVPITQHMCSRQHTQQCGVKVLRQHSVQRHMQPPAAQMLTVSGAAPPAASCSAGAVQAMANTHARAQGALFTRHEPKHLANEQRDSERASLAEQQLLAHLEHKVCANMHDGTAHNQLSFDAVLVTR
jgi:hypothetical protein